MGRAERNSDNDNRIRKSSRWKYILAAELLIAVALAGVIIMLHSGNMGKAEDSKLASELTEGEAAEDITGAAESAAESAAKSEAETAKDTDETAAGSGNGTAKSKSGHGKNGGYIVYIETGHGTDMNGDWDTGCTWSDGTKDYQEAKVMIPIAKAMVKYLRQSGVEVVTDAYDGNQQNLFAALDYMELHQMDAFVNLHCDYDGAKPGTMPLYRTDEQLALGLALSRGVHEYIDIEDRGPQYREDLDTLNSEKPNCPACLFETGNISDNNKILTEQYDEYGKGLAKGLCDFLGVEFNGDAGGTEKNKKTAKENGE